MVVRDIRVASDTADIPPRPIANASQAAQRRFKRSFIICDNLSYFSCTGAISYFPVRSKAIPVQDDDRSSHIGQVNLLQVLSLGEYVEAERYLGSAEVTTDAAGNATFDLVLEALSHSGEIVTATATDPDGNTSELTPIAQIAPADIQGLVWEDSNNDGEMDFGERAIEGVTITLQGTNDHGGAVGPLTIQTDGQGIYMFIDLPAGTYQITETQPAEFVDGLESLGTVDGVPTGAVGDDVFTGVLLAPGSIGENYNFGERPPAGGAVTPGQTATIGFWQNKNGRELLRSLNGSETATQLGDWLAATFPNMYSTLDDDSNVAVADFYSDLFLRKKKEALRLGLTGPTKMDAQVMGVAFACYVTNETLAGSVATGYGFLVTEHGVGTSTFNVGDAGAAFGVDNNSDVSILDLLLATDDMSWNGVLYDRDKDGSTDDIFTDDIFGDLDETLLRTLANDVYTAINEQGDS